ncbi:uncharacterized protein LOC125706687 isoform X2 [Brienomyrus brachyistius]|uniref:uncharacterized protein LOC125706687 isoform X2 n=1 Tax=Brienomyrus brachyistius TaxID=42636 RepID=UPI0020B233D1|nr:uncharacterized protein LOC125706687 isoform X2 [Brienomyrus brachyistius]
MLVLSAGRLSLLGPHTPALLAAWNACSLWDSLYVYTGRHALFLHVCVFMCVLCVYACVYMGVRALCVCSVFMHVCTWERVLCVRALCVCSVFMHVCTWECMLCVHACVYMGVRALCLCMCVHGSAFSVFMHVCTWECMLCVHACVYMGVRALCLCMCVHGSACSVFMHVCTWECVLCVRARCLCMCVHGSACSVFMHVCTWECVLCVRARCLCMCVHGSACSVFMHVCTWECVLCVCSVFMHVCTWECVLCVCALCLCMCVHGSACSVCVLCVYACVYMGVRALCVCSVFMHVCTWSACSVFMHVCTWECVLCVRARCLCMCVHGSACSRYVCTLSFFPLWQDQTAKDKALQSMASMSSAQIVSATAVHSKLGLPLAPQASFPTAPAFWQGMVTPGLAGSSQDIKPFTQQDSSIQALAATAIAGYEPAVPAAPAWQGRSIGTSRLRLVEFSAFMEQQQDPDSYKHLFVHIGQTNHSHRDALLESVDIREIYDKFPEKKGGLKELFTNGQQNSFFLVKFWADLNCNVQEETGAFYGVTSQYESPDNMTITCSTKVCSFGKQVVEKVEVVSNRETQETLLCIACVFEVSNSEHGAQHHIYRLVKE